MPTLSPDPARRFLSSLGADLRWRLIRANDATGQWFESARNPGHVPATLRLDGLNARFSWHVRPMPDAGRYRGTLFDDATDATLQQLIADGLPPPAVVAKSDARVLSWHHLT